MASALVVICLVIVILLVAVAWVRNRARQSRLRSAPELKPESLVDLSVSAATAGAGELGDPKAIAALCAQESSLVRSYFTEVLLRDRKIEELESKGYISVDWKVEYVRPGKYHVLQSTWSRLGYQYDEWIAIGPELYESVGEWKKKPENTRADWNESARADKFVQVLINAAPRSAELYRYRGVLYYLLRYETDSLSGFGPFAPLLKEGPYRIQMWVHRATGLLARADVVQASADSSEAAVHPDFEQVFWGYNEAIQIAPPQISPPIAIEESQA
jgi:hypothetical protein